MRSRPRLDVSLSGPRHGGTELVALIDLTARSETPIDAIDVKLVGRMTRFVRTTTIGTMSSDHWEDARLVGLHARLEGGALSGKRTSRVSFELPEGLPPTFRCATTRIEYTLDVHVSIPWWPDRRTIYEVPIGVPPRFTAPTPLQTSTLRTGQRTLGIELSLADRAIVPGEACDGAVSVHGLLGRTVRRIEVSLVGKDEARFPSARPEVEVLRSTATAFEGTPAEGAPLPFRVVFPAELTPSFETPLMALRHYFEVRVVVAWSDDLVVLVPVTVVPAGSPAGVGATLARGRRVPPVGAERRLLVWSQLGRGGLDFDAETERLHWLSGGVRGTVSVEQRANEGLWTVATLRWPSLGIGLRASNRAWHHLLQRRPVPVADPAVKTRLTVLGRETAQTAAFFDRLGDAPALFAEAAFDDEGCVVASPGGGFAREEVERFVEEARRLAVAVDEARAAIVPPATMAPHIGDWRAFAERVGGVVHLGEPRIEDAHVSGEPVEITTVWDDDELVATELAVQRRAHLAEDEDDAPAVDTDAAARLPAHARAVLDPALERGATLEADTTRLRLRLPGPLPDPARVEPLLEALAAWAKALRLDAARGPYR